MAKSKSKIKQEKAAFLIIFKKKMGMVQISCDAANITRQTYHNWRRDDSEFREKLDDILEGLKDFAESALFKNVQLLKQPAIEYFLDHKARDRGYGKNITLELSEFTGIELGEIPEQLTEDLEWEDD